jgi:flagellar biosynthetic protein FlhB
MAENKEGQEKTEPASAKRLSEARLRGQVAKSMDVTTSAVLLFGMLAIYFFGGYLSSGIQGYMKETFGNLSKTNITFQNVESIFNDTVLTIAALVLPVLLTVFTVLLVAEISQVGMKIATKKFTEGLNLSTVFNPFKGLKRIFFSGRSFFELMKSVAKILILGVVVYDVIDKRMDEVVTLVEKPYTEIAALMVSISLEMVLKVAVIYIIIAVADYIYQKYRFREDMKMTVQEVKEETKQTEGDPKVKSRIRSLMRQRIRRLMLKNVRKADVVITNPTHFAVALVYDQKTMAAPRVLAKGLDFLALRIREIATEADVPIVEEPPLARALYYSVEIDREIPENLFKAVAQVLAYVYYLKKKN